MSLGIGAAQAGWQGDDDVVWRVVEEHLDEAEFKLEQFEMALSSPVLTLEQLAVIEAWLTAHIDALVIGGSAVAERLLIPNISGDDVPEYRAQAGALALLAGGHSKTVMDALRNESEAVRVAVVRGCCLSEEADLAASIRLRLPVSSGGERGALLELAANLRVPLGPTDGRVSSGSQDDRVAAIRAANPRNAEERYGVEMALRDTSDTVQAAAMVKALAFGSPYAWQICVQEAMRKDRPNPLALALCAGLGDPGHHQHLVALTTEPPLRYAIVRALAFSGNVALVPWLLQLVGSSDKLAAKLAADAVASITGAPLEAAPADAGPSDPGAMLPESDEEAARTLPALEADDLDADLVPPPEESMIVPIPGTLQVWWEANQARFDPRARYLGGKPATAAAFRAALLSFPLGRRHLVALLLRIKSAETWDVDTSAFTRRQLRQIHAIPLGDAPPWSCQYTTF